MSDTKKNAVTGGKRKWENEKEEKEASSTSSDEDNPTDNNHSTKKTQPLKSGPSTESKQKRQRTTPRVVSGAQNKLEKKLAKQMGITERLHQELESARAGFVSERERIEKAAEKQVASLMNELSRERKEKERLSEKLMDLLQNFERRSHKQLAAGIQHHEETVARVMDRQHEMIMWKKTNQHMKELSPPLPTNLHSTTAATEYETALQHFFSAKLGTDLAKAIAHQKQVKDFLSIGHARFQETKLLHQQGELQKLDPEEQATRMQHLFQYQALSMQDQSLQRWISTFVQSKSPNVTPSPSTSLASSSSSLFSSSSSASSSSSSSSANQVRLLLAPPPKKEEACLTIVASSDA